VTEFGRPFSVAGFGNWFRDKCAAAGLRGCTTHGLRKAGATIAAENGATEHQLMAIFGWHSLKQAALYTRKADRRRFAGDAMRLLVPKDARPLSHRDEEIPPGAEVRLAPGGPHIMLMQLHAPLEEGKPIPLTFVVDKAGGITLSAPVASIAASGPPECRLNETAVAV
jgi:hypothetical protein